MFDNFKSRWIGRRVGDPLLIGHGESAETCYQCVSLIKQYMVEVEGIHVDWPGNAIDFWYRTNPTILQHFTKHPDVQKGDIVVLHTVGHNDATQPGHIGIATGNGDPNSIEILEQNGLGSGTGLGRDAIGTRYVGRNRIAGTLRPIPVTPEPPKPTFQRAELHAQFKVNPGAHKWDLNLIHPTFQAVVDNWVDTAPSDYVATVQGILIRSDFPEHQYYLEDYNENYGWNTKDCTPYVAPPPPVITPPSAPIEIPKAEKYALITTVMAFDSPEAAQMHNGTAKPLGPGEYYVRDKKVQAWNLSTDNMKDQNKWVNIQDNVEPAPALPKLEVVPTPVPPRIVEVVTAAAKDIPVTTVPAVEPAPLTTEEFDKLYKRSFFTIDGSPEYFYSINTATIDVVDHLGKSTKVEDLHPLTRHIPIIATCEKDGLLWGLTKNSYDRGLRYLVPLRLLKVEKKSFSEVIEEAINDLRIADRFNQTKYRVSKFIDGLKDTRAGKK